MRVRAILFFAFVGIFSLVYSLGAETDISEEDAQLFMEQFAELVDGIDGFGIFTHNTTLAIPMFIPGFGIAWGLFSAWSTGTAFAAITVMTPEIRAVPPLMILYASPFGIMELAAYSLAISRSFMLAHTIIKKNPLIRQLKHTSVEIGVVVGLLLAGGYLEFYMIEAIMRTGVPTMWP